MESARKQVSHIDASGPSPIIQGTRIRISQIASEYEHLGMSPDAIVQAHPHLSLSDVHAALAHYYDHVDSIREEWCREEELIASLRPQYPSHLAAKLNR